MATFEAKPHIRRLSVVDRREVYRQLVRAHIQSVVRQAEEGLRMRLTKERIRRIVDEMLEIWRDSDAWVKGYLAKSEEGDEVAIDSADAVQWCAVGCKSKALLNLKLFGLDEEFECFMDHYAQDEFHATSVVGLNDDDHTTFEDMRLFVKRLSEKEWPLANYYTSPVGYRGDGT